MGNVAELVDLVDGASGVSGASGASGACGANVSNGGDGGDVQQRPRAVIIDDGSQARETFHLAYPKLNVVGAYPNVVAYLARPNTTENDVDLVVLDLHLATEYGNSTELQGPAAIREIAKTGIPICLYTDERRVLVLAQCFAAGASGLVRKCGSLVDNQRDFLRVAGGDPVIPGSLVGLAELLTRRSRLPSLTQRQIEVLTARARGETWGALSRRLGISSKTAYDRLEAVMHKMYWYLNDAGISPHAAPADVERILGLAPGDLNEPI